MIERIRLVGQTGRSVIDMIERKPDVRVVAERIGELRADLACDGERARVGVLIVASFGE